MKASRANAPAVSAAATAGTGAEQLNPFGLVPQSEEYT
jgi:hypothetical protein